MLVAAGLGDRIAEIRLTGEGIEPESLRAVTARIVRLLESTALEPIRRDSRGKVSVLMATYNRRDMLPAAIESVRAQTHRQWELVIVNDGGESVADVVAAFGDDRIVYRDAGHVSKGAAVNTAFLLSTGEYVAYLDDDDLWHPDHLQRALFFIENVPGVRMRPTPTPWRPPRTGAIRAGRSFRACRSSGRRSPSPTSWIATATPA
jgi:cellulose synthase/poly-beta-1,6-N-acetylglucosamine synthase-like glycosyltransferase